MPFLISHPLRPNKFWWAHTHNSCRILPRSFANFATCDQMAAGGTASHCAASSMAIKTTSTGASFSKCLICGSNPAGARPVAKVCSSIPLDNSRLQLTLDDFAAIQSPCLRDRAASEGASKLRPSTLSKLETRLKLKSLMVPASKRWTMSMTALGLPVRKAVQPVPVYCRPRTAHPRRQG